ncbi:hypothetical protein MYSTI_05867 [Myxococcus stipitatus DSM 14675]|uniref:Uncharacterized protein n=1 Tax=Myxococcus stipitatus (strain DSM 14675 / JCM 12634 / Mx s8) TaxID=1278073 RepID=L7UGH8_MYXSD|nr:hypothetical protein [Myxococcus stipitatus]AGC47143.1 hypothetical protein MYSTI_05867 [Myxococcus stipitatus DSM 14675]
MVKSLRIGLSGPELASILKSIPGRLTPRGPPGSLLLDDQEEAPTSDWLGQMVRCELSAMAQWSGDGDPHLSLTQGELVRIKTEQTPDPKVMLSALTAGPTPFELASFASIHPEWATGAQPYRSRTLGGLHYPHGWLCGFRGKGHDRLVSRRWLEFGPWRVLKGSGDTTLIQFHDVAADAATALEQARVGHPLLTVNNPDSGFIAADHVMSHDLQGIYDAKSQTLRVIVHGRDVPPGEMRDACAAKKMQPLGPEKPITRVAYVFMEPQAARAHLHALWLRELECWTIEQGNEVRLDKDYRPAPVKPDWVKAVESR